MSIVGRLNHLFNLDNNHDILLTAINLNSYVTDIIC